ncbi:hypothetical protein HID58_028924, partial [Brassica napus]
SWSRGAKLIRVWEKIIIRSSICSSARNPERESILSWGSRGENDVGDSSTFPLRALPDEQGGNIARLPLSVLYDDYQQDGARRRRPFYAPPPRLTRVTPPAARTRPLPTAIDRGFLLSCFFFVTGIGSSLWRVPSNRFEVRCRVSSLIQPTFQDMNELDQEED